MVVPSDFISHTYLDVDCQYNIPYIFYAPGLQFGYATVLDLRYVPAGRSDDLYGNAQNPSPGFVPCIFVVEILPLLYFNRAYWNYRICIRRTHCYNPRFVRIHRIQIPHT